MAGISFHYTGGTGYLQKVDTRIKLAAVLVTGICVFSSRAPGLAVLTAFLAAAVAVSHIPVGAVLKELKFFYLFAALIITAHTVQLNGGESAAFRDFISIHGFVRGLAAAWRFLDLLLLGVIFTASSSTRNIRGAVESLLRPVPFVPERKTAFMMGATISMLPLISDAVSETRDAQNARLGRRGGGPVRRIIRLTVPLLLKIFRITEEMAEAMQARGLRFDKDGASGGAVDGGSGDASAQGGGISPVRKRMERQDWIVLSVSGAACTAAILLELLL